MSNLLINEPPLQVLPSLAKAIGLNEAIVLQQLHYWISNPKIGKEHGGMRWVYNSVREWQEDNFPFWSEATIKRALASLREKGIVFAENLNRAEYDRTLWYTINYEALGQIDLTIWSNCTNGKGQIDQMEKVRLTQPIPETTQETTNKDYNNNSSSSFDADYVRIVTVYEQEIGMITQLMAGKIVEALQDFTAATVEEAIKQASMSNVRKWSYVEAILKNWKEVGRGKRPSPPKAPRIVKVNINGQIVEKVI